VAIVTPIEALRRKPKSVLFEGGDDVSLSVFIVEFARGEGPALHLHPYPELFMVEAGPGTFTVDGDESTVTGGPFIVARRTRRTASRAWATNTLRVVSIHASGTTEQTTRLARRGSISGGLSTTRGTAT
jgi:mannose-6-phosphate isomerase-like protein (cupin superfamily)